LTSAEIAPYLRFQPIKRCTITGRLNFFTTRCAGTAGEYYGTALHELAHSSGAESRLNRETLNESYRFGDPNYAKEELRAELASVFLMAERGIPHDPDSHVAYLNSWLKKWRARHFFSNHQQAIM
jgi:antirestriction protein ArdC